MTTTIDDALDGLSKRELERIQARIVLRLRSCAICGEDGAIHCAVLAKLGGNNARFALLLCRKCIEAHRQPPSRASEEEGEV